MAMWESTPIFNRFILITCILIYTISWVLPAILYYTMLSPMFIMQGHIWRLLTGPFCHDNIINLLFSVISYVPSAVQEEKMMGTVPFTLRFFKLALFINVVYSVLMIGGGLMGAKFMLMDQYMGLWPILMCDIVIQCYQYPEMPRGLCCLPIQIKSKWYPIVLIAIFCIFFGP